MAVHDLNVPKITDENRSQPLDVGELTVSAFSQLRIGDSAPPFRVETLAGDTLRLEDLRGKVALVRFWASWCGECTAGIPAMKAIYEEFGDDERLVMLGMSLDKSVEALQGCVTREQMGWKQAHLGDWSETTLPSQYAVSFIPNVLIIGPHGEILAHALRGPKIREEVVKALTALE